MERDEVSFAEAPKASGLTYLILAHSDPVHLARMLRRIYVPGVKTFVHVDAKAELEPYLREAQNIPGVSFSLRRYRVMWGAYSVVEATLSLIEAALADDCRGHYVLLSGADYPLVSAEEVMRFFADNSSKQFIRLTRVPSTESSVLWRVRGHHFRELANRFDWRRKILKAVEILLRLFPRRLSEQLPICVGSQWWALTEDCAEHCLRTIRADSSIRNLFKFALAPDEMVFHSILSVSKYNEGRALEEDYHDIVKTGGPFHYTNMHYIDRDTITDAEKIRSIIDDGPRYLFARKFKTGSSSAALDFIDKAIEVSRPGL